MSDIHPDHPFSGRRTHPTSERQPTDQTAVLVSTMDGEITSVAVSPHSRSLAIAAVKSNTVGLWT
ncbi:MAG TPA: hypothetical protein VJT49_11945 [Amycolatopsis sp.]|uniref:hypothetical protein n=1 Tax=Amycolatopsis sp. TaxID=37632 RepID=UPI002B49CCA3|nr:hypothetical protein [Amycolatopsis sp.]HKS45799.1 hypothetical protein [Amycolatopsis sp.]